MREIIQIINTIVALISVPPSIVLLMIVAKEKRVIPVKQRKVNKALTVLFAGISLSAIVNATLSLIALVGNGLAAHQMSPYSRLFVNAFFLVTSWFIYLTHIDIRKQK